MTVSNIDFNSTKAGCVLLVREIIVTTAVETTTQTEQNSSYY